jgi:hypothetical protein
VAVAAGRGVRWARRALPGAADAATSRVRALVPGPVGAVARARREVAAAVTRVRAASRIAGRAGLPVGDTAALLAQLEQAASALDARLRMLGALATPTGGGPAAGPALGATLAQARTLTTAADRLADALMDVVTAASPDVPGLAAACTIEAAALREAAASMRAIT